MKRIIRANENTGPVKTFQNNRNPNKFIETKKDNSGHSYARQYMKWDTPEGEVKNYSGSKTNRGRYHRTNKHTQDMMLEDYTEVESGCSSKRKKVEASYTDPTLLDELANQYAYETDLGKVWDEVFEIYNDEDLANDVVAEVEDFQHNEM